MCGGHGALTVRRKRAASIPFKLWFLSLLCGLALPCAAWAEDENEDETLGEAVEVEDTRDTARARSHRTATSTVVVDLKPGELPPNTSVADLLGSVAGVSVRRLGGPGDPSFVRIRGSSARQVEVYIDGVPLNPRGSSAVDLSELDLDSFDRVEVHRGVTPAELGASPIGGVVHLRSRPGGDVPPRFKVGLGSWTTRSLFAEGGHGGPLPDGSQGTVRLSLGYDASEADYPYFSGNGTEYNLLDDRIRARVNNDFQQVDSTLRASLRRGPVTLRLQDRILWRDEGQPGTGHAQTTTTRSGRIDNLLTGQVSLLLHPTARLEGLASWHARQERYEDRDGQIGIGHQDDRDRTQTPTLRLAAILDPLPWLRLLPSAELLIGTYVPVRLIPERLEGDPRVRIESTFAIAADFSLWGDRLQVSPAIRLRILDQRFLGKVPYTELPLTSDGEEVLVDAMPQLAIAFRPVELLTLRTAIGRGTRPPEFSELFGDRGSVVGNPDLRPESGLNVDASARVQGAPHRLFRGSAEAGWFLSDSRDTIVLRPRADNTAVPRNIGRTWITGAELAGHATLFEQLELGLSATYSWSSILEGMADELDNRVPFVPEWQVDSSLAFFWEPWVRVGWSFSYTSGTFDSPSNRYEQLPRPMHSLFARAQLGAHLPWIAVEVTNVADLTLGTRFRDPLHPSEDDRAVVSLEDFRGNPLPGRAVYVTVGWTPQPPSERRARPAPLEPT